MISACLNVRAIIHNLVAAKPLARMLTTVFSVVNSLSTGRLIVRTSRPMAGMLIAILAPLPGIILAHCAFLFCLGLGLYRNGEQHTCRQHDNKYPNTSHSTLIHSLHTSPAISSSHCHCNNNRYNSHHENDRKATTTSLFTTPHLEDNNVLSIFLDYNFCLTIQFTFFIFFFVCHPFLFIH